MSAPAGVAMPGTRSAIGRGELEIAVRSVVFNVLFYAIMIVTMIITAPWSLVLSRDHLMSFVRAWARSSLVLMRQVCKLDYEIRGMENMPKGGFIFAGKHQSFWETFAFIPYLHDPCYIIKRELSYVPIWGWYAIKARMVFVSRGKGQTALREISEGGAREAAAGRSIMLFPDGTRRAPGAPPAYKFGVTHLYRQLGVPVLPVALNSGLYWPRRKFLRYPGRILAELLPPIAPGLSAEAFQERLVKDTEDACDRLLVEADGAAQRPPFPPEAEARVKALRGQGA
jgi:1-acyl-sn-glycerol-3-phosphate acyltransferase